MANLTPLPLPADPNALEDRLYTRPEVLALMVKAGTAVNAAWQAASGETGPSLPAPRPRLTLLQGGAA